MKMKKQKLILLLLIIAFMSSVFEIPMNVFANDIEPIENDEIQPRYSNLQSLQVGFRIDEMNEDEGDAIATVITSFYSNTSRILIKIEFQRKDPDDWYTLATTWAPDKANPAIVGTSITVNQHGYYYRVKVTVELYDKDGNLAETVTLPSKEVYF